MSYRYQRIHTQIWHDEKFKKLSNDGKTLFLYFLTSPHSNLIGYYMLPWLYIESDLGWNEKRVTKPFTELLRKGLIKYDDQTCVLFIVNHFHYNTLDNPNQKKSAVNLIGQIPKSPLISDLKTVIEPLLNGYGIGWVTVVEPLANIETEAETEAVTEAVIEAVTEEEKVKYGEFGNVLLVKKSYEKLISIFGEKGANERIENLSTGIASKGYKYKDHYATILSWERKNNKGGILGNGKPKDEYEIVGGKNG